MKTYYLAIFTGKGKCLKVIESKGGYGTLELYALQHTTGKKTAVICNEKEEIIMYFKGQGNSGMPRRITNQEEDTEGLIGGKVLGVSG